MLPQWLPRLYVLVFRFPLENVFEDRWVAVAFLCQVCSYLFACLLLCTRVCVFSCQFCMEPDLHASVWARVLCRHHGVCVDVANSASRELADNHPCPCLLCVRACADACVWAVCAMCRVRFDAVLGAGWLLFEAEPSLSRSDSCRHVCGVRMLCLYSSSFAVLRTPSTAQMTRPTKAGHRKDIVLDTGRHA